ncbi:kinase-like domain-containing protein [Ganoderma leucocontextum]|nr:kinase-like domain-containing protein [Ganoderma leucocontextum]
MRLSYLSKDRIGKGGYGKVFAAKITSVGDNGVGETVETDVALKKARVTNHIRHPLLLHEAWALIVVRGHPNIPRVLGWGRSQYFEYLIMERHGPDLEHTVKEIGLTERNAVALICQMLDAIEYIHGKGIVHCDIKPSNFVLGRGDNAGRLYLIDFGLAWQWTPDFKRGGRRGTVPYSSLRVLGGEAPLPRDDLESLAYTIVRLVTGTLPWAYWSSRQRLDGSAVSGRDLVQGYPDVFAQFVDFARGLTPTDDLQYRRWREAFRGLKPSLPDPEHPMFNHKDRGSRRLWVRWVAPTLGDGHLHNDGKDEYMLEDEKHVFGGSESRSEMGGDHGFDGLEPSEWYFPVGLSPRYVISNEFDVVSRHLDFIDEPPLYDGGRSVEDRSPPEVMNNTQSNSHCIRL